jgi:hypothetical protein
MEAIEAMRMTPAADPDAPKRPRQRRGRPGATSAAAANNEK